jgi:hypothetical protein
LAKLARAAEECQICRDLVGLEAFSDALIGMGSEPARSIGQYYRALVVKRFEHGDIAESERILIECSAGLPPHYRSRALLSHANSAGLNGNRDDAARLFVESWRAGMKNDFCDLKTVVSAARFLAFWRATDGGAASALDSLDGLFPMVRAAARIYPFLYYDHLDTTAFVAGMLGRWQEAKRMSDIVVTAPMASSYPNWREHHRRISREVGRRSSIVVPAGAGFREAPAIRERVTLARTAGSTTSRGLSRTSEGDPQGGRVLSIAEWKASREGHSQERQEGRSPAAGSLREKKARILALLMARDLNEAEADEIYLSLELGDRQRAIVDFVVENCYDEAIVTKALQCIEGNRR